MIHNRSLSSHKQQVLPYKTEEGSDSILTKIS